MSLTANSTVAGRARPAKGEWARLGLPLAALYAALLAFTRPSYIGDTFWYALDIDRALGHGATPPMRIWDFAHLLLRPVGLLLSRLFLGTAAPYFDGSRQTAIVFLLIVLSVAAAFICAALVQKMTWELTRSYAAAFAAAAGFLCLSVVLNYSRSGASYLPGLACSLASLYQAGFSPAPPRRAAVWSGVFAAFSVLFWLPYVASFPAILLAGPVLRRGAKARAYLSWSFVFLLSAGSALLLAYGAAAAVVHVTGWSGLAEWIRSSNTQYRDRKLLRMVTGWARSFYEIGNDAVYLKWYLFKDPYARFGLGELLRVSFLKLALFYASMAGLAILLWIARARALLLFAAVAMLPHLGMALMFESGSPERYLPGLPAVFLGFGYAIANRAFRVRTRVLAAVLCCAHIPPNLAALSAPAVNASTESDAARIAALSSASPGSLLYVVNGSDGLFLLRQGRPFHPLNRKALPQIDPIVPLGPRVPFWRADFACTVLSTWRRGGEIWVTRRILSDRPARQWLWVEGDDRRLSWNAIHSFFSGIERGPERGGPDGFFLVPQDDVTRSAMLANIPAGDPRNCPAAGSGP